MRDNAIIVDTNLLLLWAVGEFDSSLIGKRRLDVFAVEDYDTLLRLTSRFRRNLTTPHVLAELSDLADSCVPQLRWREFREFLKQFIDRFDESWVRAAELCESNDFMKLGLPDASICRLALEAGLVVTKDNDLYQHLLALGINVENFNHLVDS